jgi:putative SOS response-associated peptidase YedK
MRWGLVPAWVADPRDFPLLINARAEGIMEKPAYRNAMRYRRCLVPASGFYEWRRGARSAPRQPYWVPPAAGGLVAFAGLWETWSDRDGGEIDTAAIVTVPASREIAAIHDRMPVVIAPQDQTLWLSGDPEAAAKLLVPAPDGFFAPAQVSARVNTAEPDDPGLIVPVAPMRSDLFDF